MYGLDSLHFHYSVGSMRYDEQLSMDYGDIGYKEKERSISQENLVKVLHHKKIYKSKDESR